jgi:excisionase family DNA binding protein
MNMYEKLGAYILNPAPDLLTVAEVADYCRVTPPTVMKWIQTGALVSAHVGNTDIRRCWRVLGVDLVDFVQSRKTVQCNYGGRQGGPTVLEGLLRVSEVAIYCRVSHGTVIHWLHAKSLVGVNLGTTGGSACWRVSTGDLELFLQHRKDITYRTYAAADPK